MKIWFTALTSRLRPRIRGLPLALSLLLGFSGLAALIYEVTWMRLLGPGFPFMPSTCAGTIRGAAAAPETFDKK